MKSLVSANVCLLDPTNNLSAIQACDNDKITVTTSNCLPRTASPSCYPCKSFTTAARALWGMPTQEYLNAITILTTQVIANMGAMSIFIMDSVEVVNKCLAHKPLVINMPDGQQMQFTHICDITIPGLPTILMGHIVPHLAVTLLIGIRSLCNAGCTIVFEKDKCVVLLNGKVIL
jgi:hypothetical protein